MYCSKCGHRADEGVRFCPSCGEGMMPPSGGSPGPATAGDISDAQLEKYNVWLLILVTIVTLGIYTPVWFLTQRRALNDLRADEKLTAGVFLLILVFYCLSGAADSSDWTGVMGGVSGAIGLVGWILSLIQAFKARRIISSHWAVPLSGVATFFFQHLYLQWKINRLLGGPLGRA